MTTRTTTRVLVVGGGPGGYVAAIRAAQLGLETTLVEADRLGGACLIRGCIPSKAIIHAAEIYAQICAAQAGGHLGIRVTGDVALDFGGTRAWKDGIIDRLSDGVGALLRRANVKVLHGWAVFQDAKTCRVTLSDGGTIEIQAQDVVLATGSEAVALPGLPFGGDILSSTEALSLAAPPERLAIVGAGYIGLELGLAFAKLGSGVTIVEAADRILPQYDAALTAPVTKAIGRRRIDVHTGARAERFEGGQLRVRQHEGGELAIPADKVLVTVGRRARLDGWGLDAMGVDTERGVVRVDDRCATSMAGVWAIGDLTGEPMLAHRASAQGEMVAELIAGRKRRFDATAIPAVCFTDPEIVTVGAAPGAAGTTTAVFPLSANGRAMTLEGETDGGFVRIVASAQDQRIVGFAAVGRQVSELSGEMCALIEMGAVLEDAAAIIHAHPTQSESLGEAALRALGHALHI
ncbi:MAG: dihydrolipoyl dehydrogenase [Phenylobacterium sp.]|uniref:dihydrolipoyl dehydrogenase n=1 Tax=Phenylobacterium sp. TaxID=1871053 RepID=UPI0025F9C34F|nr:dihydrolipoyl dehydrogenase [Phenylobacterium sp.]MBI1200655.1 dihydrolipoyl dehydrogenase [Phenylobacterium sp.]